MIRFKLTTTNPVTMNSAARLLTNHPRLDIQSDSGNKTRIETYERIIEAKILNKTKTKPKARLREATKSSLAQRCWAKIVHQTDSDEEAVLAIVELIEYVERTCLKE